MSVGASDVYLISALAFFSADWNIAGAIAAAVAALCVLSETVK